MCIYLYHKQHRDTKLNYFGKSKNHPLNYKGSGVYWSAHLRKHGHNVETVNIWEFESQDECTKFALQFSQDNNIVESKEWANLCVEDGKMGGNKLIDMSPEQYRAECAKRSKIQIALWKSRSNEEQSKTISKMWQKRSTDDIKQLSNKISNTLRNKTPEQKAEAERKRQATIAKRPTVTCPHCGLTRKQSPNMTRYHFDNCKRKLS